MWHHSSRVTVRISNCVGGNKTTSGMTYGKAKLTRLKLIEVVLWPQYGAFHRQCLHPGHYECPPLRIY